jgi:hypothetical protein
MVQVSREMRQCTDTTTECLRVCTETLQYSLKKGGRYAEASHLQALMDCVEACRVSMDYMLRGSEMSDDVCGLCVAACERCATACERFRDDAQMRACVEACRSCASTCQVVAA